MEFSIGSALRFGWETFKTRPWFFVGVSIVIALVYIVIGALSEIDTLVGTVLDVFLSTLAGMGVTAFYLAAHDSSEAVELSLLWHPRPFWKYFAATIVVGIAMILGLILLIVPGIIFALMFMFTTFIVIDRELGPIEAMKESMRITRGHKWPLLGFVLVLGLLNVAGAVALGVGLLVSIPVSFLAFVHAYRTLAGRAVPSRAVADAAL